MQSRLEYMVRRDGGADAPTSQPSQALAPTNMLFMDEQYVVSLFQARAAMGLPWSKCCEHTGDPAFCYDARQVLTVTVIMRVTGGQAERRERHVPR